MPVCSTFAVTDAILQRHATALGADGPRYRHHVYRVLNHYMALTGQTEPLPEALQVAAACHDLGIWTNHTWDYLAPSVAQAEAELASRQLLTARDEVAALITEHHKLRAYRGMHATSVEAFRQADLVDVSMGLIRCGLPRSWVQAVHQQFPKLGFHRRLATLTLQHWRRHPLHPLPMVHW